jgi:hypothetical protein
MSVPIRRNTGKNTRNKERKRMKEENERMEEWEAGKRQMSSSCNKHEK